MTYAYNTLGRMTSATNTAQSRAIAYTYDARGLRTGMNADSGTLAVTYGYDDAMRLSSIPKPVTALWSLLMTPLAGASG